MTRNLIQWYSKNKRDLPFRKTKDPYKIWLSEIILQQTRVEQGLNYYLKFVDKYPTVADLSKASSDEVMILWQGLGYYSRARNLLVSAKMVEEQFGGEFPDSFMNLKKLKGVGDYTAAAIASIAYDEVVPVVDGNVYRVLSRLFAEQAPIDSSDGRKRFRYLADQLMNKDMPGEHNQALMELGALVCTPKSPSCEECPFETKCLARAKGTQEDFPVKHKKIKQRTRYLYLYIVVVGKFTYIHKREKGDIWEGLYQFPVLESEVELPDENLVSASTLNKIGIDTSISEVYISKEIRHILSHQILKVRFIHLNLAEEINSTALKLQRIDTAELSEFAMPRLITRYLSDTSKL